MKIAFEELILLISYWN